MNWIKISDRLPENNQFVLVICKGFSYSGYEICQYNDFFESQSNGDDVDQYVSHWIPLNSDILNKNKALIDTLEYIKILLNVGDMEKFKIVDIIDRSIKKYKS